MTGLNDFLRDHNYLLSRTDNAITLGPLKGISKWQNVLFLTLGTICLATGIFGTNILFLVFGIALLGFAFLRSANRKKKVTINVKNKSLEIDTGISHREIQFGDIEDIVLRKTKLDTGTDPFNDGSQEYVHSIVALTKKGKDPVLVRASSRNESELSELEDFSKEIQHLILPVTKIT